jgi:hypothetical protein
MPQLQAGHAQKCNRGYGIVGSAVARTPETAVFLEKIKGTSLAQKCDAGGLNIYGREP